MTDATIKEMEDAILDIAGMNGGTPGNWIERWCRKHAKLIYNLRVARGKPPGVVAVYIQQDGPDIYFGSAAQ